MKHLISEIVCGAGLILSLTLPSRAEDVETLSAGAAPGETKRTELTLANFFSAGWRDPWSARPHTDEAPDLALLRVQTNQVFRALRTDYYFERLTEGNADRDIQSLTQFVDYAFNRRLMLSLVGNYEWIHSRAADDANGPTWGALARFQMVDTRHAMYALNFRLTAPNGGLEEKQTTLSLALTGWHDLTPLGLKRVGLYWHVQEETLAGPHPAGARQNDLTYDLSLAKTWTQFDAPVGNLTIFVEAYAKSDLDGPNPGRTVVTLTPGFRCTFARHHIVMMGVELPVTHSRPFDEIFRVTYIYCF